MNVEFEMNWVRKSFSKILSVVETKKKLQSSQLKVETIKKNNIFFCMNDKNCAMKSWVCCDSFHQNYYELQCVSWKCEFFDPPSSLWILIRPFVVEFCETKIVQQENCAECLWINHLKFRHIICVENAIKMRINRVYVARHSLLVWRNW